MLPPRTARGESTTSLSTEDGTEVGAEVGASRSHSLSPPSRLDRPFSSTIIPWDSPPPVPPCPPPPSRPRPLPPVTPGWMGMGEEAVGRGKITVGVALLLVLPTGSPALPPSLSVRPGVPAGKAGDVGATEVETEAGTEGTGEVSPVTTR